MLCFSFRRFNPERSARGLGCAELVVNNGLVEKLVWMTLADVESNLKKFSASPGLLAAKAAYHSGVRVK